MQGDFCGCLARVKGVRQSQAHVALQTLAACLNGTTSQNRMPSQHSAYFCIKTSIQLSVSWHYPQGLQILSPQQRKKTVGWIAVGRQTGASMRCWMCWFSLEKNIAGCPRVPLPTCTNVWSRKSPEGFQSIDLWALWDHPETVSSVQRKKEQVLGRTTGQKSTALCRTCVSHFPVSDVSVSVVSHSFGISVASHAILELLRIGTDLDHR